MMNDKFAFQSFLHKFWGYYLIPHELLHVLAYRIIGKPCAYEWGNHYVRPLAKRTKGQRLFVLLFPFAVCWTLGFLFYLLWLLAAILLIRMPLDEHFRISGLTWHYLLPVTGALFIIYGSAAHGDLVTSYNVLVGKDKSHQESYQPQPQSDEDQRQRQQP